MSTPIPPSALKFARNAYAKVPPPRVFAIAAGKHWGQRGAQLNAEQFQKAFLIVHEQYQRGYRGLRLNRNVAMRMAPFCNTNSSVFLTLPTIAGQVSKIYLRWRKQEGITDNSGTFTAVSGKRPPSSQLLSKSR